MPEKKIFLKKISFFGFVDAIIDQRDTYTINNTNNKADSVLLSSVNAVSQVDVILKGLLYH